MLLTACGAPAATESESPFLHMVPCVQYMRLPLVRSGRSVRALQQVTRGSFRSELCCCCVDCRHSTVVVLVVVLAVGQMGRCHCPWRGWRVPGSASPSVGTHPARFLPASTHGQRAPGLLGPRGCSRYGRIGAGPSLASDSPLCGGRRGIAAPGLAQPFGSSTITVAANGFQEDVVNVDTTTLQPGFYAVELRVDSATVARTSFSVFENVELDAMNVNTLEATLEEVFIHITGKALKEL